MEYLSWELSVLSRAVAFSNISAAASNIGLSQPQISRIVAKLEDQLGVALLDRDSKRKSSWTPEAYRLSDVYHRTFQQFKLDIQQLTDQADPEVIRVGALEGLMGPAMAFCKSMFERWETITIELEINDLDVLEEHYFKGNFDFMFSSREPGRKKPVHLEILGYQTIAVHGQGGIHVMSSFEYANRVNAKKRTKLEKIFVSNSLAVREHWIHALGGSGTIPSPIQRKGKRKDQDVPVLFYSPDHLSRRVWERAVASLPQIS